MATFAGKPSSFYSATGGTPVEGAWYNGRRYMGGRLLAPGEYEPGKVVSDEVANQTNPNNADFIRQQRSINASEINPPTAFNTGSSNPTNGLNAQVNTYRKRLEEELATRSEDVKRRQEEARARENEALKGLDEAQTPFREERLVAKDSI